MNPHLVVQGHVPYQLDHPGVLRYGALDGDRTRLELLDRQSSPPEDFEGAMKKAWWWCAGEDSHLHSRWPRGYGPLGSLVPEPARVSPPVFVWLAMPIRFSMCGSRILRAKRKGPGVARPLVGSLFSRESSSCSHRGDSGPGDARLGSYPRTDVLAGYIAVGRRPQPTFRLRVPNPLSFCLWHSWQREDISVPDSLSSCQFDYASH